MLRIFKDKRLKTAINAAEAQTKAPMADIIKVILENLPEVLGDLNNPAALVALIIKLVMEELGTTTPAPTTA